MKGYQEWLIDDAGNKRTNVTIEVRVANSTPGAGAKATIFSNAAGAAKANPFTNLADGSYSFFANDGRYDVVLNPGTVDQKIIPAVEVVDGLDLSQRAVRVASGETAVAVPPLAERTGDEDTVWAFDKDTGAAKALPIGSFPPGPQGPPGTNNTVATLEALAALSTSLVSAIAAGATFIWKTGNYSSLVDGVDYVQSNSVPATTGAWVRIGQEDLRKLGAFSGSTIPDNQTPKQAMQALETAVETKVAAAAVGVSATASNLGTFTSPLIDDNATVKAAIESIGTNLDSDDGAGFVGFKQTGTDTTSRTVDQKLKDFANVADYLPDDYVTDGSVDYTTQIQKCINDHKYVQFPAGTFRHGRLVLKHEGQVIAGMGMGYATVLYCPSGYGITNYAGDDDDPIGADWVGNPTFRDMVLRGGFTHTDDFSAPANSWAFASGRSKTLTTSDINAAIRLKRCFPYQLQDIIVENFHRGVYLSAGALGRFDRFLFSDCEIGVYGENGTVWGDGAWQVTTHRWSNGRFRNVWFGINGTDFVQCSIDKKTVDFEPCNTGIAITNGADNVWSGYFELCYEGIYRNGSFMGHDVVEDAFFAGEPGAFWGNGRSILMDSGIGANGKLTIRDGQRRPGGGGFEVLAGKLYRSEFCSKTLLFATAVTPAAGYTPTNLGWVFASGYDDCGVFDTDFPELLTIPAWLNGATVKITVSLRVNGDATANDVQIDVLKNGAQFPGSAQWAEVFEFSRTIQFSTGPVKVVEGDEFSVNVLMNLARTIASGNQSWLMFEVIA